MLKLGETEQGRGSVKYSIQSVQFFCKLKAALKYKVYQFFNPHRIDLYVCSQLGTMIPYIHVEYIYIKIL